MLCTSHDPEQKIKMESSQLRFFDRLSFQALEYLKEIEGAYFMGNYSLIESGDGNNHIFNRGAEKERYTVQLTFLKSGRNLPPFIIFKGASPPPKKIQEEIQWPMRSNIV